MINAIAELGRYAKEQDPQMTDFDIWLEDSYDGGKYDIVFFIVLERADDTKEWGYKKIDVHENGSHLKDNLVYKRGTSRGTDKTPTAKVAKSISGTFKQKVMAWFVSNKDAEFLEPPEKEYLDKIHSALIQNEERIIGDLEDQHKLTEAKGVVLSLQLIENENKKYIGDIPSIAAFIIQESKASYKFSKTFKKYSYSTDKVCSICNDFKKEVFGYFTSLGFYTVDKPGMVAGGFLQDQSWKNYPVCLECALDIETGIKEKENYFDFRFYGCRYYLIPRLIHNIGRSEIIDTIKEYNQKLAVSDEARHTVLNPEEDVIWLLRDNQNHAQFTLLFYDKPQKGVFRIVENIEEVLPSRIKRLYDAKSLIDEIFIFKLPQKDGKRIFRFSFGVLRLFFPRDKARGNHDKDFLQIVHKVFAGMPIQWDFLISQIMIAVRNRFANAENEWFQVLSGFMMISYFYELGLLNDFEGASKMATEFYNSFEIRKEDDYEGKVVEFFIQFEDFFGTHAKKAIFLTGVLTKLLLNIQQATRESTPFRSQLKGLKMDSADIQGLLPKIEDKLAQYKHFGYKNLRIMISQEFLSAGDDQKWSLTIDEMNYIFVLGMNLSDYFKVKKEDEED
ncbi:TIGR02556 family CRISPR-associated protein [Desulfosarcina ovata]|uniref:Type I-B CRISPR-associated protein Cas8b/Csh1 n=1 Tax=Desulfosarcina ovata subsp. ovata TaxID=2752305 RepID=A0A5K8A9U8_9BACT|nr:TIGR02556 family CRISPR-associated protein [Desulfosarcina ovata]BBO89337.1 type I-B CRISPR-associated protein Cas8b/Csh1 [Desulfosarcina ovata subsp. ovata]